MTNKQLQIGDRAPEFVLLAAHDGDVAETSLEQLLEGHRGLVLTTYVLDFTGGLRNQVSQFRDAYDEFRRGGVEVGVVRYVWHEPEGGGLPVIQETLEEVRRLPGSVDIEA